MPDYYLYRGGCLLGALTRTGGDFPRHNGTFEPAPTFAEVRSLFDRERHLLEADRIEEWGRAWDEIAAPGLRLDPLDGRASITEFLVHIDGTEASWRY